MERKDLNTEKTSGNSRSSEAFCVFNGFKTPLLPAMNYCMDGLPGQRVLFISDMNEVVTISFEQDMKCLDLTISETGIGEVFHSEYRLENKYLHQLKVRTKVGQKISDLVYFHMEITDVDGEVHICPGQMRVSSAFQHAEGMEPIFIELLNGVAVHREKDGG